MLPLTPEYFSSTDKNNTFIFTFYPKSKQWRIVVANKQNHADYWLDLEQAKNVRDLLIDSIEELEKEHKQPIIEN